MDGKDPQIHEVWTFGEDGVTREVHPTAQVDFGAGIVRDFTTNYLTGIWRRFPMFVKIYINGSVEWLGIPDFHRTDGLAWTAIILDPRPSLGDGGYTTNTNWGSQYGGVSGSVAVPWNFPVRVLPVYRHRILQNTRAAARRVREDLF